MERIKRGGGSKKHKKRRVERANKRDRKRKTVKLTLPKLWQTLQPRLEKANINTLSCTIITSLLKKVQKDFFSEGKILLESMCNIPVW